MVGVQVIGSDFGFLVGKKVADKMEPVVPYSCYCLWWLMCVFFQGMAINIYYTYLLVNSGTWPLDGDPEFESKHRNASKGTMQSMFGYRLPHICQDAQRFEMVFLIF